MNNHKLIGPFKQLLPMSGLPQKGALKDEQLSVLENAGILIEDTKIAKVGDFDELLNEAKKEGYELIFLEKSFVAIPGLVDAHTHICFGGTRAHDYAMRNAGKTYLEIAAAGGGIWDTVTKTRKASEEELTENIVRRALRHLSEGVTSIEVKSGYGLSVEEELKMLRAIKAANTMLPVDLIPTCLAAHMLPRDFEGSSTEYLQMIIDQLLPQLKEQELTNRVDIFVEQSAFSVEEGKFYLNKAKELGFELTIHADQFSTGGSTLAVEMGALSADHLEASTEKEIEFLAKSNTVAVALPGASLGLGCNYTPARKLLDAGGALAIATDWNPGSAPMGDLIMQASVLGTAEKLSNAEVLAGITYRSALALNLTDRGTLSKGALADFVVFPTSNYQEITYQQGKLKPNSVWKNGREIFKS